jgi:hypothetical protein
MPSEMYGVSSDETHEQFIQRANRVFPADSVRAWSRVERAVFNHLMAKLIHRNTYGAISNAMLHECRDDMTEIVSRCRCGENFD